MHESFEKLIHVRPTQRDLGANRPAFANLEAGDGFARTPLFDAQVPLLDEFRAKQEFVF